MNPSLENFTTGGAILSSVLRRSVDRMAKLLFFSIRIAIIPLYVFETLIFRWKEALRESSGNFEELQELFEIVVKFRDPQVKPRLQKIIERSPKFSELLSSDRIADALIQGDLLRGIVNWSGADQQT